MGKSHFEATSEKIEKYLSGIDRAQSAKALAEDLGMTTSLVYNTLRLMEVFNKVLKVKRGGRNYYLPHGVYDEGQISALLPPKKVKPEPRRKSILRSQRRSKLHVQKNFLEKHLSTIRAQSSSFEGPSALAMIGLNQIDLVDETVEVDIDLQEVQEVQEVQETDAEEEKFETPITSEPFATIQYLPKNVRRLTRGQTKHLKEQLKFLDGYDRIESLKTVFARLSALEKHKYGRILYFSMGTNPWDYVQKVTIDPSISDFMFLPNIELKRWASWKDFMRGLKEPRISYGKDQYDKIIDQFIETDHKLVEITVENRKANYINLILNKRIDERGLEEQVKASFVSDWVYLEKVE